MHARPRHRDTQQQPQKIQWIETNQPRPHEVDNAHAGAKSSLISMAEDHAAHHEKEVHGKIAPGRRNRHEHLAHVKYDDA